MPTMLTITQNVEFHGQQKYIFRKKSRLSVTLSNYFNDIIKFMNNDTTNKIYKTKYYILQEKKWMTDH